VSLVGGDPGVPMSHTRRPQEGHFGAQTINIAASHPAEPWYYGIGDLNNRRTDHGGPMKVVDLRDASDLYGAFDL
jgi:hypothetical protein